jgi:prepilin-type N-terminal cleavage/methylation domain-containing protein
MQASSHPAGFTLLELVVVMALLAIVAGFAAPRLDLARFEIQGGVHQVSTSLMLAHRAAIEGQHDVVIAFDQAHRLLRIHHDGNNNGEVDGGEAVRTVPLGEAVAFGRAGAPERSMGGDEISFTRLQAGLPVVVFHSDGSASEEGGLYLTSRSALESGGCPEDAHAIEVERATGRVSWFRYEAPDWRRGF